MCQFVTLIVIIMNNKLSIVHYLKGFTGMKAYYRLKNKIYKVIALVTILILTFSMAGCSFSDIDQTLKENKSKADDKYWSERNVPPVGLDMDIICPGKGENFNVDIRVSKCVYKFLNDGDKKQLMKMFATSVTDNYDNLEKDIDELIIFYQKLEVTEFEMKSNSMYKVHRVDPPETIYEYTYHSKFDYKGDTYELDIMFVKDSNPNEDLEGVHGIKLRNCDTNETVVVNTVDTDI